jgi:hypothetical protein
MRRIARLALAAQRAQKAPLDTGRGAGRTGIKGFQLAKREGATHKANSSGLTATSTSCTHHQIPTDAGSNDTQVPENGRSRPFSFVLLELATPHELQFAKFLQRTMET